MNRTTPSALVTLARIGAIALAIGVVAYLVWRAQSNAAPATPEEPVPAAVPAASPSTDGDNAPQLILLPSSKDPGPDTLLPSSKFAPLPSSKSPQVQREPLLFSSKSLVIENEALLPSSKSGRPVRRRSGDGN